MIQSVYNLSLDIKKKKKISRMEFVTLDTRVYILNITLTDDEKTLDITGATYISFVVQTPSRVTIQGECTTVDPASGKIKYELGSNEISEVGTHQAEIKIFKSGGALLTTTVFEYTVRRSLSTDEDVKSSAQYSILQQALEGDLKGDPGEDGASAYQIALENGFEGTAAEWLESLKGSQGEPGTPGSGGGGGGLNYWESDEIPFTLNSFAIVPHGLEIEDPRTCITGVWVKYIGATGKLTNWNEGDIAQAASCNVGTAVAWKPLIDKTNVRLFSGNNGIFVMNPRNSGYSTLVVTPGATWSTENWRYIFRVWY